MQRMKMHAWVLRCPYSLPRRQTRSTPRVDWVEKTGVWMPLGPVAGTQIQRNRKNRQIDMFFASQNSYLETISENILSIEI